MHVLALIVVLVQLIARQALYFNLRCASVFLLLAVIQSNCVPIHSFGTMRSVIVTANTRRCRNTDVQTAPYLITIRVLVKIVN